MKTRRAKQAPPPPAAKKPYEDLVALITALKDLKVQAFSCEEFQVVFNGAHGGELEDMRQIGFQIDAAGNEDDDEDD